MPALFFLSFLPQFADPLRGSVQVQLLTLGIVFVAMAVIGNSTFALLSGTFGTWIKRRKSFVHNERYVTGTMYCGLGVAASLSHSVIRTS